jgi:transcriptional regulator with XRE-family HTH domain
MNTPELQRLKIAWLAAKETGNTHEQLRLLQDHPAEQDALIDFIAGYYATETLALEENVAVLPLTQRATQRAMERVFGAQAVQAATLAELRAQRQVSKVDVARGLRLSVDVWNKFENGAIELVSLSQRQIERLAQYFQISIEQFSTLLSNSQPAVSINRRQTRDGARKDQQGPQKQSLAEAIERSAMSKEDKRFWLEQ